MPRVTVPRDNYSIRMPDGTRYAVKDGHAEVSQEHMQQINTSSAKQGLDMIMESAPVPRNRPDRFCPNCLFNCVFWVKDCTRCGTKLPAVN